MGGTIFTKEPWNCPEIYIIDFGKTEGGLEDASIEDDIDYYNINPSGEV